jgi:FkbM family methyltransferase
MTVRTIESTGKSAVSGLRRDVAVAAQVWTQRGIPGIAAAIHLRLKVQWQRLRQWWYGDHDWLGRLVELRGDWVRVEGCRFDLSHPQISRGLKGRLLRGRYERSERELLSDWLDPNSPVIELGGGIGIVATLVNRRLRDPERHLVVEANPSLIGILNSRRIQNHAQFSAEHGALDHSGSETVHLQVGDEFISGRVGAPSGDTVAVPAVTLEQLLARYPWTGLTLICDIEGAETELVEKEGETLGRHCDTLIIEVHPEFRSREQCDALFARLENLGFERVASVRKAHAFRHRRRLQ